MAVARAVPGRARPGPEPAEARLAAEARCAGGSRWISGRWPPRPRAGVAVDVGADGRPGSDGDGHARAPGEDLRDHDDKQVAAGPKPKGVMTVRLGQGAGHHPGAGRASLHLDMAQRAGAAGMVDPID